MGDEEETDTVSKELQIKSSHDLLKDPKLSSVLAIEEEVDGPVEKKGKKSQKKSKKQDKSDDDDDVGDEDKSKKKKKNREEENISEQKQDPNEDEDDDDDVDEDEEKEGPRKKKRKDVGGEESTKSEKKVENDMLLELARERSEFLTKQKTDGILKKGDGRQDKTLALLASFQSKVSSILSQESDGE